MKDEKTDGVAKREAMIQMVASAMEMRAHMVAEDLKKHGRELLLRCAGDMDLCLDSLVTSAYLQGVLDSTTAAEKTETAVMEGLGRAASLKVWAEITRQGVRALEKLHLDREKAAKEGN